MQKSTGAKCAHYKKRLKGELMINNAMKKGGKTSAF
jgi:hypothetical protein